MVKLPYTSPEMYKLFKDGYHVIRRSDRYWAGLSTALIVEQMLMRSLKHQVKKHDTGTENNLVIIDASFC